MMRGWPGQPGANVSSRNTGHYQLADPSLSKFVILSRIMASSIYAGFYFIAVALITKP